MDILCAVNVFIDFLLLLGAARLLRLRVSLPRLLAASVLGGALSLAALLPRLPVWLNLLSDAAGAALLVATAFGKTDVKSFLRRTAVFFAESFFFCGIMFFICSTFRPKGMEVYNDVVYFNISPILLILFTLVCYYLMKLFRFLADGAVGKPLCTVKTTVNGREYLFRAMIDTGCSVKEPFSGADVIVAERSLLMPTAASNFQYRIIPFQSLGGEGVLQGIRPESVEIDGKATGGKLYIGLCDGVLKGDVKAIVPFSITKEL